MDKEKAETECNEIILTTLDWESVEANRILYNLIWKGRAYKWDLSTVTFSKVTHNLYFHYLRLFLLHSHGRNML